MACESSLDRWMRELAERQGGYVHRSQLLTAGVSRGAIDHRLARGYLISEYYCVYAVGRRPTLPLDRAHGALLAGGPGSALRHASRGAVGRAPGLDLPAPRDGPR